MNFPALVSRRTRFVFETEFPGTKPGEMSAGFIYNSKWGNTIFIMKNNSPAKS
jgi:hypothetical protein